MLEVLNLKRQKTEYARIQSIMRKMQNELKREEAERKEKRAKKGCKDGERKSRIDTDGSVNGSNI